MERGANPARAPAHPGYSAMPALSMSSTLPSFLPRARLQDLLDALRAAGYGCVGPRVRDGAIVFEPIESTDDLPHGARDRQAPGEYRLERTAEPRCFAWAVGPQALKPLVFAPRESLWRAERDADGALQFVEVPAPVAPTAVIGVRACDLAALALQDRHFLERAAPDPHYAARRRALFLVAVHCSHPAVTCFCASTGDGPRAASSFDVALAELDDGFLAEEGSARGAALLAGLKLEPARASAIEQARAESERAAAAQARRLPGRDLRDALMANLDHPRWEAVAQRCLACTNCTSVCPTCFCHAQHAAPDLDGLASAQVREWDSCFSPGHGYIHGWPVRPDARTRYRQWLVHKLGTWHDQYGRSGCVGCGRCIAWCPAAIDLTAEAAAICGGAP